MTTTIGTTPVTRREILILGGILLLLVILRLVFLHEPFERDEGTYAYIGQEILRGAIPYRDMIEIKPPGVMYIYAAIVSLTGASLEGIRIITALYATLTCTVVFLTARRFNGSRAGLLAALLFAVYEGTPMLQGSSSNSEVFMLLPIAVATYYGLCWLDTGRRSFLGLSGLAMGVALLIKTVALPNLLVVGALIVWRGYSRRDFRRGALDMAAFGLPIASIFLGVYGYFWLKGALPDMVYWTFTFLKSYGAVPREVYWSRMLSGLLYVGREHVLLWAVALPTIGWLLVRERTSRAVLLAMAVPAAFLGLSLPGKFYPHYFIQLLPPLALVGGVGLARCWENRGLLRYLVLTGSLLLAGYSVMIDSPFYWQLTPDQVSIAKYDTDQFALARQVGNYLRARTRPDDYLLQWGWEPEIYFYADRRGITPYIADVLVGWSCNPPEAVRQVLQNLEDKQPRYVVMQLRALQTMGTQPIQEILGKYYFLETVIGEYGLFRLNK